MNISQVSNFRILPTQQKFAMILPYSDHRIEAAYCTHIDTELYSKSFLAHTEPMVCLCFYTGTDIGLVSIPLIPSHNLSGRGRIHIHNACDFSLV